MARPDALTPGLDEKYDLEDIDHFDGTPDDLAEALFKDHS